MHPYLHLYTVESTAASSGDVTLTSTGLPALASAPPPEFDGPGGRWSPEHLLVAAVADCLVLSFRGVARANKFEWHSLDCSVEGTLNKVEGRTRFTHMVARATLRVPAGTDEAKAKQLLERAEHVCLVSNSLVSERSIESTIVFA